jgi:hypothetical protein
MSRIRTIGQAYKELKLSDPNTAITQHSIRQLILSGQLPAFQSGNKYLFDLDVLEGYLSNPAEISTVTKQNHTYGNIKPVNVR